MSGIIEFEGRRTYWRFGRKCDKCGEPVTLQNSVLLVQGLLVNQYAGFVKDRHLFPTQNCEGSPSRVKLVETEEDWKAVYDFLQTFEFESKVETSSECSEFE